jgi:cell division protease FtsH
MSEETAKMIDEEVRRIVTAGEKKARETLFANRDKLEAITQALMEFETITGEEVNALMRGEKIVRTPDDEETKGPAGPAVPAAGKSRPPRTEPGTGGLEPYPQT